MMIAGILMAAMLAASAALSLGLLGASTASAGGDRKAPRVRTVERTITVRAKHQRQAGSVAYVIAAAPSDGSASSESEFGSEHEFEDELASESRDESDGYEDD
jgi:hypothetical protein